MILSVGQAVRYRGSEYRIRAICDGLVVIGREADPVEVTLTPLAAFRLLDTGL
jgi:hypothetical protein